MNTASKLLHDPETGDWIVVAPKRAKRPTAVEKSKVVDRFSSSEIKRHEKIIATYGRGRDSITAIENKFPVFVRGKGASGYQEILVEGKKTKIENVLRAYAARAKAIRKMRGLKSLITFKNDGPEAGASQPHPHSQIFALAFVPKRYNRASDVGRRASRRTTYDSRLTIFSDRSAIAYANPTPRFPFEAIITTRRAIDNLTQATPAEIASLAKALRACLAFTRTRKLSYNFFFHDVFANPKERFEIRFVPRGVNVWGGFELDAGITVNPVPAEQAAEEYRNAKTR